MASQLLIDYPELSSLPREDLEDMLADPAVFHSIFHSLPRVAALFQAQSELGMANESIAKKNLSLQDDLYKLRADTQDAFNEAKSLEARQKELEREQKELYQRYAPSFLQLRLRHSTTAQDNLSEQLATAFVRSTSTTDATSGPADMQADEFVRQFKELRKTYHKRAMWGEKWANDRVGWRDD